MKNLFIIGSPRSGTTFLASLLEMTEYGSPYETQYILKYLDKLSDYGDLNVKPNFARLVKDICAERAVAQRQPAFDLDQVFDELPKPIQYLDLVNYLFSSLVNESPSQSWGDKTPHYILQLEKLIRLFPNAKFIYLLRDGRDVAMSLLKKDWGPNNTLACARDWTAANGDENQLLIKKMQDKGQLTVVRYESLVANYKEEVERVLAFLGEPLEKHQDFINQQQARIKPDNFNKWKSQMSPRQIRDYEAAAGDVLKKQGYEITTDYEQGLSALREFGYDVHNFFVRWKNLFKMNVIDGIKIKFFGKQPFAD